MYRMRIDFFEIILLIVAIASACLGFLLMNEVYSADGTLSWLMVIAIFNWLMLIVLFIALSLNVDISKKQLHQMMNIVYLLSKKKK